MLQAAYWMGETGTGDNDEDWGKIVKYLKESDADWSYWAIDGQVAFLYNVSL